MGVNGHWQQEVLSEVQKLTHKTIACPNGNPSIINLSDKVAIRLLSIVGHPSIEEVLFTQSKFQNEGKLLINLWEDIWLNRKQQVLARFTSLLGNNKTCYGRETKCVLLPKKEADNFFITNHLMGFTNAFLSIGLHKQGDLLAVASFGKPVHMKSRGQDYFSAELIRFATLAGTTIAGGLSKLVGCFLKQHVVNDVMTYADRDWSIGAGYPKIGFQFHSYTPPQTIYVNTSSHQRFFLHRLPPKIQQQIAEADEPEADLLLKKLGYEKIFNTGNNKYYLYT